MVIFMAVHFMIKEAHSRGNCQKKKWHKTFWWSNVDYLILETNWRLVTMVLGILLACCLVVIIILLLTRNTKYVCDHHEGTVHSPELIQWEIVFSKIYIVLCILCLNSEHLYSSVLLLSNTKCFQPSSTWLRESGTTGKSVEHVA